MPLDRAAREVLSTLRNMLAAAFIFLSVRGCSTTIGASTGPGTPGVTVWLWLWAVGAQLSLALGETQDWLGTSLQDDLSVFRLAPGVCTRPKAQKPRELAASETLASKSTQGKDTRGKGAVPRRVSGPCYRSWW